MTKTTEPTVEQTAEILTGLKGQCSDAQQVIKSADGRRRKVAYAASQGDRNAAAELEKVAADEAAATGAMRNLQLAIEVATREHEKAWARKHAAAAQEIQEMQSVLDGELIAEDLAIIEGAQSQYRRYERRAATIDKMSKLGALSEFNLRMLNGDIDAAIMGGLGRFAPRNAFPAEPEALLDLVENDCRWLGKKSPMPPRKLTITEAALQRSTQQSGFGSTKKRAVGE